MRLSSPASRTSSSKTKKKKTTNGEEEEDDVDDAKATATKSAEDDDEEEDNEKKTKSNNNNNNKKMSLVEFLTTFSKLLETREGIDKTLKTVKYASVLSALVLTTNTKTVEIFSTASDAKTRERTAQKLRKLAKSLSLSRGSLRLGKFLKFSLQCREHLALDAAREEEKDNADADDDGSRFRLSSSKRQRRALEFLALFAEATYYFLEQGVWLQNVGVFRSEDAAKRKELKVLAMKVEFFMYATSIPLRVVEWRDLDGRERAAREKKNEAIAYERSMSTSKRLLSFISSPQKRGDEVGDRIEDTRSDGELALAKANAVKSIVKDGFDLVLVTSDLEWIRERRVRDFVANEWVYSMLSLSSALISISKLWVKAMRA